MSFSISVIIPVFNGERFIKKAIDSALNQSEVSEIVVINDGSTDNTLNIIEELQKQNPIIKVYHHKNKLNKGRSASRNLGIKNATENYIAFLDADDFYLENRFKNDKEIFENDTKIDGVYNAIGAFFYRDASNFEQNKLKLTTVSEPIKPDNLFEELTSYRKGYFSIDGLTVKKSVFNSVGYFTESLQVAEDTEMIYKLALKHQLKTGIIEKPVAMRGVHDANVFNNKKVYNTYRVKMFESLFSWANNERISIKKMDNLLNLLWLHKFKEESGLIKYIAYWSTLFFNKPKYLFSVLSVKYFPVIRLRKKLFPFIFK